MAQQGKIALLSDAFTHNQVIPIQYGCSSENINPPLSIDNIPVGTQSLVLIVDDRDSQSGDFTHWLLWNIPADTSAISMNSVPTGSIQGLNDFGTNIYDGPCPPQGVHRYQFKLYALDTMLNLNINTKKIDLMNAMDGHILDKTILTGLYSK